MAMTARRSVVLFLGLAASPALAAGGFAPGQWEHHTDLQSADVPGIPQWLIRLTAGHGDRRTCNGAAELESHPETLLKGDDSAVCKLRRLTMSDGKLVYDTFCTNRHFPDGLLVSSRGTYTPTSYTIATTSTGTKDGKPVRILTTGSGRRIAESCGRP